MSALEALLFDLEGELLLAADRAANARDCAEDRAEQVRVELVVPIERALAACRALQAEPWSL